MDVEGGIRVGELEGREFQGKRKLELFTQRKVREIRAWIKLAVIVCSRQCKIRVEVGDNRLQRVEVLKFEPQKLALPLWVLP